MGMVIMVARTAATDTEPEAMVTTARGRPSPRPPLSPMPMLRLTLMPTTEATTAMASVMVWVTAMDLVLATVLAMDMVDMADMVLEDTTARGRLMPRPDTISVVDTTEVTDTEDSTARGTPMLRPVTTRVVDTTEVMDTGPGDTMVDTDTGVTTVTRGRASHAISPKFSLELSVKC